MIHPLPTYENVPWRTAQPIHFQADAVGVPRLGGFVFNLNNPVPLLGSDRASSGAVYLFDHFQLGVNMAEDAWRRSLQNGSWMAVRQSQSGPTLFRTPVPLVNTHSTHPLRFCWIPSGDPSELELVVNAKLVGDALMDYPTPTIHVSFLVYEIADKTYLEAITRAWQEVSDLTDPLAIASQNGVRLVAGADTLREYH